MIRIIILVVIYFISQLTHSQAKFEQGMNQAFTLLSENKYDEATNMLERIANAEPENWLPPYHIALLKARTSFSIKDKSKQEAQIKSAENFIADADVLSSNNSEIYVVKAMINVAKIASNPMVIGAALSGPTSVLYQKAIALDKTNPRAHSGLVEFEMGSARFFKQDLTPFCQRLQESIKLYDDFKPANKFSPNWGKEWTLKVIEGCDNKKEEEETITNSTKKSAENVSIKVTIPNVSGTEGVVLIALYNSLESFTKREPIATKKSKTEEGKVTVVFEDVSPGTYAVVCLHDKNGNERMDFDSNGMPEEAYGSSNNNMRMGPPNFEDAKFTVENKSLDLTVRF